MSTAAPSPGSALLATKLYARPVRANLVARPRLTRLLDEGQAASLILLSAPAGFGKTTLLAEWLAQGGRNGCWLSLDAADNDPPRFLAYLFAALQRVLPQVAGDLALLLRSAEPPSAEALLATLVNEVAQVPDDLILVLDDYHVITSPAVNCALTFLLENLPHNLHLLISTRSDPAIPVARLRSRGQVVELRTDELRFTPEEAAHFLNRSMGLALSAEQVAALDERAEGWIAGLQMAALSMRGREDVGAFIRAFAGTNRFILDFLVEEVLAREPEEVQSFLLQTAVLTRLCGPLCDAVTGGDNGREMLERLERRNLFVVPLDDDRRWYRYHHLFADLLQARLHQSGSAPAAQIQARAAEWCEQDGQIAEAVGYALAARDHERAGSIIARHWSTFANEGEVETVWSWLTALPEEMVCRDALLSLAYCWVLWLKGQMSELEAHLLDAERALDRTVAQAESNGADGAGESDIVLRVQVATLRSIVARYGNDVAAACAYAEKALAQVPADLPPQVNAQLRALIFLALGSACDAAGELDRAADAYAETIRWSFVGRNATGVAGITFRLVGLLRMLGRLRAAEAACRKAMRFMEEQGLDRLPAAGILHVAVAGLLLERNQVQAAEDHLALGAALGKRSGRLDAALNAAPVLVRLRLARGEISGALAATQEAELALGAPRSHLARAELLALQARVLLRQGSLAEAAECATEAARLAGQDRGQTGEAIALAASRLLIARSTPGEAVADLTRSLAAAENSGRLGTVIELRLLRCLTLARQGARQEAEADLLRALSLAAPEGFVRVFVDEGPLMAEQLRRVAARAARDGASMEHLAEYASRLLAAFDAPGSGPRNLASARPAALIEPLSEREREVLGLMAEGLTNEQIAGRLIIALGTVKAHVHNIAGKLGAQNRAHAVARAKELELL